MTAFRSLFPRRLFPVLALALLIWPALLRAQVLDDSTKVLYGAKTTRILREADILNEQYEGRLIDTTLTNQMQARNWFHDSTFQQDLGNVGTASRRLLWEPNVELGARFGRNAFDKYVRNSATIPYYDTRSPYTFFRFIQSGFGEQVFELSYNRSIGKNASVGLAYERFASNKLLQANGREGLAEHSNVLLFGRFQGKNDRYHGLFSINTSRHRVAEQGGIRYLPSDRDTVGENTSVFRPRSLFDYQEERVNLTQALNVDDRDQVRLVQTYRLLGKGLTAYHILDWKRQFNKYSDERLAIDPLTNQLQFYPRTRFSPSITNDRAQYRQVENTVGIMGHSEAVAYRLYGRYRDGRLTTQRSYLEPQNTVVSTLPLFSSPQYNQLFVGGTASFRYRKLVSIETAGEILAVQLKPKGKGLSEYWFRGTARLGPLSGEFLSSSYSPTLTQQRFTGNHYFWDHTTDATDFRNTLVNQLTGRIAQRLGRHYLEASVSGVTITDLVYYKGDSISDARGVPVNFKVGGAPAQLSQDKVLLIGTLRHRFNVGKFYFDNQGTFTSGGDGEGLRIPALVANGKVYYQNYLFKKALFGQIGAEVYYQSRFKGYDYSPSTQQFYVQDNFTIRNYSVVDVFLITDIKTVSFFLKVAYVNQGLYDFGNGYFASPYYTGLPRRFQLGIKWQFFD
ncbi:putative porin [Hymenobacter lucidus]|uniref:Porin n=1 Tax=Hymenobacter lucidus TaxID=2880930 RepID=A0ABS8AXD5_9BACT|nr:putative porin [Hymenobacter lucidus]MCB2410475.1 putative porin [Hymenobacter lucidus]